MRGGTPLLADWDSFFVIVGSSAGALTGLMFVVITLSRDAVRSVNARHAMRAFASPTIVHFTAVLLLSAVLSMPRHTRATLGTTLLIVAAGALVYVFWIFLKAREQDVYAPDRSDWIWHFSLPAVAYGSILVAGIATWSSPKTSTYVVAAAVLGLLITGIRNAWDSAVWIVISGSDEQGPGAPTDTGHRNPDAL